jgi:uncharacterized protein (TIGR02246 family)
MRLVIVVWATALAFALAPAAAAMSATTQTVAPTSEEAEARKAIDVGNRRYLATLRGGDASGYAALYTIDGIQMPSSGRPIIRGRATILRQTAEDLKTTNYLDGSIVTTNAAVFGATAYETGRYTFTYQEKGKQPASVTGRYFVVWERQPGGEYLIKVDAGFPAACPR